MTRFELPWPPSVNHYWLIRPGRKTKNKIGNTVEVAGGKYLSDHGKNFRALVGVLIRRPQKLTGRLRVHLELRPPDRKRRDVDNYPKSVLDALTYAGVWNDDEQIDDLRITRGDITSRGSCVVTVEEINNA